MEEVPEEKGDCAVSCSWTSANADVSAQAPTARARILERPKGKEIHLPMVGGTTELLFLLAFCLSLVLASGDIPKALPEAQVRRCARKEAYSAPARGMGIVCPNRSIHPHRVNPRGGQEHLHVPLPCGSDHTPRAP